MLSKHLKVPQDAGYLEVAKPTGHDRVRAGGKLTPRGRRAYAGHVAALQCLLAPPQR